ncbi:hypothetical protein ACNQFN_11435 [Thauera butanivorans]|uniref:hypothetical protein n=1 Tax=Thauera butanivorans TaxID=86174 RepID=UPI003AB176FE
MQTHAATPPTADPAVARTCANCARVSPAKGRMGALGWGSCAVDPGWRYVSLSGRGGCHHGNAWKSRHA